MSLRSLASLTLRQKEGSERLYQSDAYWFPVIGSCVLFGFYLLFTYFSKEYINYLLTAYFAAFGAYSLGKLFVRVGKATVPENLYMFDYYRILCERKKDGKPSAASMLPYSAIGILFDMKITWLHALMSVLSVLITAYYVWTKNWVASNLFGEAFAMTAISLIHLDTFNTGMILLTGLFVYDIFWVFGTNVMVSVAKSFNVPVKLLFPRNILASPNEGFSMLGLGDIVIPGTMIALALKFDHHLIAQGKLRPGHSPYFHTSLAFYVLGLCITMGVMHVFNAAQPALLYLSPAGILSVLLTALVRGELKDVFAFTTEPPAEGSSTLKESESEDEDEEADEDEDEDEDGDKISKPIVKAGKPTRRRTRKN